MKIGIVGRPASGKTTLFQALCRGQAQVSHSREPVHGVVVVPDERFDLLVRLYNPKKISPATIDFVDDIARLGTERSRVFSDEAMGELRTTDAITYVIDAFDSGAPDAEAVRAEAMEFLEELSLRDLMIVEGRLERIAKQVRGPQAPAALKVEQDALEKVREALEAGRKVSDLDLPENEARAVAGFQLLAAKPVIFAVNVGEDHISDATELLGPALSALQDAGSPAFCLSAEIEQEVAQLPEEEQAEYLAGYGIQEPVRDRLIRSVYERCRLITFFTVSEKEVHAWPLPAGSTALEAADSIHSDLARGFIRAEVISWPDIRDAGGWDQAKAAGKLRLVGKEHVIEDGDCLYIRFKV
ncbi:MAG: DUF933 domain-containing protein [Armatimonadota bacterium]